MMLTFFATDTIASRLVHAWFWLVALKNRMILTLSVVRKAWCISSNFQTTMGRMTHQAQQPICLPARLLYPSCQINLKVEILKACLWSCKIKSCSPQSNCRLTPVHQPCRWLCNQTFFSVAGQVLLDRCIWPTWIPRCVPIACPFPREISGVPLAWSPTWETKVCSSKRHAQCSWALQINRLLEWLAQKVWPWRVSSISSRIRWVCFLSKLIAACCKGL